MTLKIKILTKLTHSAPEIQNLLFLKLFPKALMFSYRPFRDLRIAPPLAPTPLPKMCTNLLRCKKMDARRVFGNIDRGKIKVVVEKVVKTKFVVFLVLINAV